jgi:hypothetical protein
VSAGALSCGWESVTVVSVAVLLLFASPPHAVSAVVIIAIASMRAAIFVPFFIMFLLLDDCLP